MICRHNNIIKFYYVDLVDHSHFKLNTNKNNKIRVFIKQKNNFFKNKKRINREGSINPLDNTNQIIGKLSESLETVLYRL